MGTPLSAPSPRKAWEPWRHGKASGTAKAAMIREGFGVALTDLTFLEDVEDALPGGDFLKFQCKIEGESAVSGEDRDYHAVHGGQIAFVVQPTGSIKHQRISSNTRTRSVTLSCSREFMSSILPASSVTLPTSIDEFLQRRISRFSFASIPLPAQMRMAAEDMLQSPFSGRMGEMMLEGKALELLCLTLHEVLNVPASGGAVRARDLSRVRDLCDYLENNPASTLSIAELCRLVAWNETQMMECFKQVTGKTISNYRHQIRMEKARQQLAFTDATITEIAFDAGYEHPSNFATAFKRTFGFPPKMARARCN